MHNNTLDGLMRVQTSQVCDQIKELEDISPTNPTLECQQVSNKMQKSNKSKIPSSSWVLDTCKWFKRWKLATLLDVSTHYILTKGY